jgi:hypothetical protein
MQKNEKKGKTRKCAVPNNIIIDLFFLTSVGFIVLVVIFFRLQK